MDDPYATLGVARSASADEIRAAYRKLAKQHHPDLNPGKKEAEDTFKAISAAHALLSDPEQRARFDRGEIDATGAERAPPQRPFYRDYAGQAAQGRYAAADEDDLDDILAMFRRRAARGADVQYTLTVSFEDAVLGAQRRLDLPDGRTLDVRIPAGLRDGQVLRLKGQGMPGRDGAEAGDALIEIHVAPHRFFRREGNDVEMDLPVTLKEAILGARIMVPTLGKPVMMSIPPNTREGTRLRLKGRGIAGGDLYVVVRPVLPAGPEPELAVFLESWEPRDKQDPRRGMLP